MSTVEILSPNRNSPRNQPIRRLTPHCVAGNLTVEATLSLKHFLTYDAKNGSSTNYAIGGDGRIGLGVAETDRAWTSSSRTNDQEAITFEIANNTGAPDWRMTDAAINSWLNLAVEICKFYGYTKVGYKEKPANITIDQIETWIKTWAKSDEMIVTLHYWFDAKKECPGPYFIRQLPWLVGEMNKRLSDPSYKPEAFVGEGSTPPTTIPKPPILIPEPPKPVDPPKPSEPSFKEYMVRITANSLNIRKGPGTNFAIVRTLTDKPNPNLGSTKDAYTIVEEKDGLGARRWGRLKSGIGWISLDYTKKV